MADRPQNPYDFLAPVPSFTVTSTDIRDGETIPAAHRSGIFGAGGSDISPQLAWSGFPDGTRSFTVTCYDPDAPTPSGFWHWVLVDLPGSTTSLATGAGHVDAPLPGRAFHVRNDWSSKDYGGAYPPPGDRPHRYYFVVHALDVDSLGVDTDTSAAAVSFNMVFHTLARAQIVPVFSH